MKIFLRIPVFIFVAVTTYSCNQQIQSKKPVVVENEGVKIAFSDTGKGEPALLFVHGWCINKSYWNDQIRYFQGTHRTIAIDLPGFGESGKNRKEWDSRMFSRDVDSVIRVLGLKKVILIGHSMAGVIVLQAALDNPQSVIGIIGIDNFKNVGEKETKESRAAFLQALKALREHFIQTSTDFFNQELFSPSTSSAVKERILNDVKKADSNIAVDCLEPDHFNDVAALQDMKKPLYLINSDFGPTDTTGLTVSHIPYRIYYIHGTGHYPMIEKPDQFNVLLDSAIADIVQDR